MIHPRRNPALGIHTGITGSTESIFPGKVFTRRFRAEIGGKLVTRLGIGSPFGRRFYLRDRLRCHYFPFGTVPNSKPKSFTSPLEVLFTTCAVPLAWVTRPIPKTSIATKVRKPRKARNLLPSYLIGLEAEPREGVWVWLLGFGLSFGMDDTFTVPGMIGSLPVCVR